MAWIVVVPNDEVGGPVQVYTRHPESRVSDPRNYLSAIPGLEPVRYGSRVDAEQKATEFRCGLVVEEQPNGEWVLPKL